MGSTAPDMAAPAPPAPLPRALLLLDRALDVQHEQRGQRSSKPTLLYTSRAVRDARDAVTAALVDAGVAEHRAMLGMEVGEWRASLRRVDDAVSRWWAVEAQRAIGLRALPATWAQRARRELDEVCDLRSRALVEGDATRWRALDARRQELWGLLVRHEAPVEQPMLVPSSPAVTA